MACYRVSKMFPTINYVWDKNITKMFFLSTYHLTWCNSGFTLTISWDLFNCDLEVLEVQLIIQMHLN
jgi:hypothetical protein